MRYIVEIEQVITVPMVVDARNEREARKLAKRLIRRASVTDPEAVGDPIAEPPRIRAARKLGD